VKKWLLVACAVVVVALLAAWAIIQSRPQSSPVAQTSGYTTLPKPIAVETRGQKEVLEFFWFGCPHCYEFEPHIKTWAATKSENVNFVREAPPLNPGWLAHSEAFYAARSLNVLDLFFEPMFHAIHRDNRPLNRREDIADFAAELGIDRNQFVKAMGSSEVKAMITRAMEKASASGIRGVPSVVINGQYLTGASVAGSYEEIVSVIESLTSP